MSIKLKPSTRIFNSLQSTIDGGFTLAELLTACLVATMAVSLSLGVFATQRRQFLTDRSRADINQNLRVAMDLVGTDIKQAGERLSSDTVLPGISILNGGSNANPDTLVLQRKSINEFLPVCQTITAGTTTNTIDVALTGTPAVANCGFSDGDNGGLGDGLTDNLNRWQTYRCSQDGTSSCARTTAPATNTTCSLTGGSDRECGYAYIHDPTTGQGEFFVYAFENSGSCTAAVSRTCNRIYRADGGSWQNTYTYSLASSVTTQPRIYILEERQYNLVADTNTTRSDDFILQLRINRQTPISLANQLSNFKVIGWTSGGDVTSFNVVSNQPRYVNSWQQLQYLRVNLTAIQSADPDPVNPIRNLTLSSQFFPRNVLSR
jgi:hypothetical protein